jgi:ferredoxin
MSSIDTERDTAKVSVNWSLCDGNAACVAEAPSVFDIDDDDEMHLLHDDVSADELGSVEAAVAACPKHALSLER